MTSSSNNDRTRRELGQLRREPQERGTVAGYSSEEGGAPRPLTGDEDAAFTKSPPFAEDPQIWLKPTVLPVDAYMITPEVDVQVYRLLRVYAEMRWVGDPEVPLDALLSMIPEGLALTQFSEGAVLEDGSPVPQAWYVMAVVDPAVSYITPTGEGNGYGSRTFAASELRTRTLSADAARVYRFHLAFDVADATKFRLKLLQTVLANDASSIALAYQRSN